MELKELYKHEEGGKTYIAIGNGSEEIEELTQERIGEERFYTLREGKMEGAFEGSKAHLFYFLEDRDFEIFKAYEDLPDGWEMVGHGDGTAVKNDEYDYVYILNGLTHPKEPGSTFRISVIYARKPKPKPFKWVKDRMPTEADADEDNHVAHYYHPSEKSWAKTNFGSYLATGGMPWARTKDTAHFTADNPAPSPFDQ